MKNRLTRSLTASSAILAGWVALLITPANDFLSLTGIYNLPMPARAEQHPVDPDKGYYLEKVADGVYFLAGWSHNTMFVVTEESVVVLDAPPSIGKAYLAALREVTDKPVSHVIYSHSHSDHIAGANMFEGAAIIAHEITGALLEETKDPLRPVPTVTFDDTYTLSVGGKRIELAYHGPAHGPGNIAVYLPKEKVLSMIDIAFPTWVPIHELAIAEDIDAYYDVYDDLLAYDFEHFVGGHAKLGSRQDVKDQFEYVLDIRESARAAYASVGLAKLGERAAKSPNTYVTVNFGLNRMASQCAEPVVEKWGERLAGVDVFTHSHCKRMVFQAMTE